VAARDWELGLPSETSDAARFEIARAFATQLVERYGVAADVAVYAPHREGDRRNHHAHILTTTRVPSAEGLTDKTPVLDSASTGGPEIESMRGFGPSCKTMPSNWRGRGAVSIIDPLRCSAKRLCPWETC
jgi:hypothetical protein